MLLSVIVPMYKTEQYLHECLDSLRMQDLADVEFILVDDGSPDRCGEIADTCAASDERFVVIHKPNGGLVSAWKAGLERSSGEYIGFVDSDDFVDNAMFVKMINAAVEHRADIVCCGLVAYDHGDTHDNKLLALPGFYDRKNIEDKILPYVIDADQYQGYSRMINSARVNKLFKRELLVSNIAYYDQRVAFGEDLIVTYAATVRAASIYVMDECLYYYRYNSQSITHKYNPTLALENELCTKIFKQITEDHKLKNCENQIYRNAAHISFRLIANVISSPDLSAKEVKKAIKNIVSLDDVAKGAKLVNVKNAPLPIKVKFFLLRHKLVNFLYLIYRRKNVINH